MENYKVKALTEMLNGMKQDDYYLCKLKGDNTKSINLDENAIMLLIEYYSKEKGIKEEAEKNKYYLYLDREASYWAYLTDNPKKFDKEDFEEGIYLYATVTNLQELWKVMEKAGYDGEYISHFIEDLNHYDYNVLAGIDR